MDWQISGADLWNWWQRARQSAIAHTIPPEEADWLLQELTGLQRLDLRLGSFQTRAVIAIKVDPQQLEPLWRQRLELRMPVQYLAGELPWRDLMLQVTPAVLIPRPETECLIDLAKTAAQNRALGMGHWADLGTGSGAIALGLAVVFPQATIHAVDCSDAALAIARSNADRNCLTDRVQFYQGNWFEPLNHLKTQLSGMVANPPYIPTELIANLQPEVAQHEPHLALDGGADGLDCVRQLINSAPDYLIPGGIWLVELMADQATHVAALLEQQGNYCHIEIHADLAAIDRFVLAQRR